MKRYLFLFLLLSSCLLGTAQDFSCLESYTWNKWHSNYWVYYHNQGWVYAYPYDKQPKDFYFRFSIDRQLFQLPRKEWKTLKQQGGWQECTATFEYYISDDCPDLKSAFKKAGFPCAKPWAEAENRPMKLVSEKVTCKLHYTDDDEVRTLNFFFPSGVAFGLTVHWNLWKNKGMEYMSGLYRW